MEVGIPPYQSTVVAVREASQVGEARRSAVALARQMGLPERVQSNLAIVVSEAGKNLVQHAGEGQLVLRPLQEAAGDGIEVLALDQGRGMADVGACLRDGYSTAGTAGTGLGAMQRLSDSFDVYSQPGQGTAVLLRLWRQASAARPILTGAVCVAKAGERICGDGWAARHQGGAWAWMVSDGLGHGPLAAEASRRLREEFLQSHRLDEALMAALNEAARGTRGAALAVAAWHPGEARVRYLGVGNIAGSLVSMGQSMGMVSSHGTLGREMPRLRSYDYPITCPCLLILHSDGLTTRWSMNAYPGLLPRDPALIAGVLYRDCRRTRDDATVMVARLG